MLQGKPISKNLQPFHKPLLPRGEMLWWGWMGGCHKLSAFCKPQLWDLQTFLYLCSQGTNPATTSMANPAPMAKQSPAFPSPRVLWVKLGFLGASCKLGARSSRAGLLPLEALGGLAWTLIARGMDGCQLTRMIF